MTISEAVTVLHQPSAYGGFYGAKYGQALSIAFECMKNYGFRGRFTGRAIKFKFCPICGRELSKAELYVKRQVRKNDTR